MNREDNEEKEGFDFPINFESIIPSLVENINLFRLIFTPLELYTLKFFLIKLKSINIREIHSHTSNMIYCYVFNAGYVKKELIEDLINAGYVTNLKSKSTIIKRLQEGFYKKQIENKTGTEKANICYKELRKNKMKLPSYDKFRRIFKRLEELGIIYKNKNKEKPIYYRLNPKFYQTFKDKINDIINLGKTNLKGGEEKCLYKK